MPKDKTQETPAKAGVDKKPMLADFVGEYGKTEKDIIYTGSLLPQYLGKVLLERLARELKVPYKDLTAEQIAAANITPCVGLINRVDVLPVQERKSQPKDFSPFSLMICKVKYTVSGFRGKEEEREEEIVEKGGDILFALAGEQTVDKQLHDAIRDLENIYLFAARPVGLQKLRDRPEPMTNYEVEIVKTDLKRIDQGAAWALPPWYVVCVATDAITSSIRNKEHVGLLHVHTTDGIEATPAGNVINRKTGEVVARLGEGGRVLPPEKRIAETAQA